MAINEEKFDYNLSQQTQHAHTTHLNSPFDLLIHHIARNVWYLLISIEKLQISHLCKTTAAKVDHNFTPITLFGLDH